MVEVHDDKALVTLGRADNREKAKRARRLRQAERAAGFEPARPGVLHMDSAVGLSGTLQVPSAARAAAPGALRMGTAQSVPPPPPDAASSMRLVRFSVAGAIVLALFVLWFRQRRKGR